MGLADDIMQEFMAAYPEAAQGRWSQQELNQKLHSFMQARNQKPLAAFDGLSAQQMHALLNNPFGQVSILGRQQTLTDDVIDQVPFFRLIEILQGKLSQGPIKLTTKGNLPLSVCGELYETKLLTDDGIENGYSKKISEDNVAFIQALKACLLIGSDVKKLGNALSLTQTGQKSLSRRRDKRFWELFDIFTTRFNWGYLDLADTQVGYFGWAYSLYLLHRYGAQHRKTSFYASKAMLAFPNLQQPTPSGHYGFTLAPERVYQWRFIEKFAAWFGLIEFEQASIDTKYQGRILLRKSPIFSQIFLLDTPESHS
ncbi:hypothetical protein [Dyadobacter pollutisoli]|uniref:Uncharacterized protein n=1 Tax=Dyadobacter pollutisoli TaxID=2910158 RepID=A0A9E8NF98_9BACT|nr:hypothetical protein [Dyadobacter pollutisoli]WAC13059.1 hypothetical protein ON006_03655 [Dyadobacter pollutisoli]